MLVCAPAPPSAMQAMPLPGVFVSFILSAHELVRIVNCPTPVKTVVFPAPKNRTLGGQRILPALNVYVPAGRYTARPAAAPVNAAWIAIAASDPFVGAEIVI